MLLEDFEGNPFLQEFYKDPEAYATETEFAFLMLHYHQLRNISGAAVRSEFVCDFHLAKDLLYAGLNLRDDRIQRIFRDLHKLCSDAVLTPALTIFLSASTDLILERIALRNRRFESKMDRSYYAAVNEAYEAHFGDSAGDVLRVRMDEWDFVRDPSLYRALGILVSERLCETGEG